VPAGVLWRYSANRSLAFGSVLVMSLSTLLTVTLVWETHFALARRVNPATMSDGFYQPPSASARAFLTGPDRVPVAALPAMIAEAGRYALWYDATRPTQDRCNPDDHSSSFWMWPVGGRAVPYQWDTEDEGRSYRYLYLQVNPVVWWTALAGLLAALALLVRAALVPGRPLKHTLLLPMFTGMYFAYFVPFLQIRGVVYLYHYFIPLLLAFVILAIVIDELATFRGQAITNLHKQVVLGGWLMAVVTCFWLYKPVTYYERPLTHEELQRRNFVGLWDLRCPTCPRTDGLCRTSPP
jgi:dolichyl-phosphate-mannose-protein mannosyltransferase